MEELQKKLSDWLSKDQDQRFVFVKRTLDNVVIDARGTNDEKHNIPVLLMDSSGLIASGMNQHWNDYEIFQNTNIKRLPKFIKTTFFGRLIHLKVTEFVRTDIEYKFNLRGDYDHDD